MKILRQDAIKEDPVVPGSQRIYTAVEANYNPAKLGLIRQHVIFRKLPDLEKIKIFEKMCDYHPFTHYRTLLLGQGMNAYAQFDIPLGIEELMDEFYDKMSKILGCKGFEVINSKISTYSELKFDHWNQKENRWNFSVFGDDSLDHMWNNDIPDVSAEYLERNTKSVIHKLNSLDLMLLREVTINARVKAADIGAHYNKDRTTISHHLGKLDEILDVPSLYYDRLKFDLNSPQMIIGKVDDAKTINQLHAIYELNQFPFRSILISDGPDFIMLLMVPPSIAPEISYFMWSKVPNIETLSFSVSEDNSWQYPFYPNNYDVKSGSWKVSREYVIDDTINEFRKYL